MPLPWNGWGIKCCSVILSFCLSFSIHFPIILLTTVAHIELEFRSLSMIFDKSYACWNLKKKMRNSQLLKELMHIYSWYFIFRLCTRKYRLCLNFVLVRWLFFLPHKIVIHISIIISTTVAHIQLVFDTVK